MSKNKKASSNKQQQAEMRNKYFGMLHQALIKIGIKGGKSNLTRQALDFVFMQRYKVPPVIAANQAVANTMEFKVSKDILKVKSKQFVHTDTQNNFTVSMYELFTIYTDIAILADIHLKGKFETDADSLEVFRVYKERYSDYIDISEEIVGRMTVIYFLVFSNFTKEIFWLTCAIDNQPPNPSNTYFNFIVHQAPVEKRHFTIDGSTHVGYRVIFPYSSQQPTECNIPGKAIGIPSVSAMPVYVQAHVFDRMFQRLDVMKYTDINFNLFMSLLFAETCNDTNGNPMFVYRLPDAVLGYLPFEVVDGAVVLKTFLFVTNDTTPVGAKLNKIAGLQKHDKQYLQIDKLSAFVSSDINTDPELVSFFEQADCAYLLQLHHPEFFLPQAPKNLKEYLRKYLFTKPD